MSASTFHRGNDKEIYEERKELGRLLFPQILKAIGSDMKNTVFSYIPNTAETSFLGMVKEAQNYLNKKKEEQILAIGSGITSEELHGILEIRPRIEKVAIKDAKLRTFITQDSSRDDLVAHVYDISYGSVTSSDNLVIIDDSIVRGTTLKKSILRILDRLSPRKIIVVSSAPQIRYPDCYGIDMAKLEDFIAFRAALDLHREADTMCIVDDIYKKCMSQQETRRFRSHKLRQGILCAFYRRATLPEDRRTLKSGGHPGRGSDHLPVYHQPAPGLSEKPRRLVFYR